MIIDRLSNSGCYQQLGTHFENAFRYLKEFTPATPDGRYELNDRGDYALVQTYETLPSVQRIFESHREYIDIQFIVAGHEAIYYRDASTLKPKGPYNSEKDATYYEDADDRPIMLHTGEFSIFWPHDAHKPACVLDEPCTIRKVVVKVRITARG